MAEPRRTDFPIKRIDEETWEVDMAGNKRRFGSLEEAELIASIPVEYYKGYDDTPGSPDIERVKRIAEMCKVRSITSFAIRRLQKWAKDGHL